MKTRKVKTTRQKAYNDLDALITEIMFFKYEKCVLCRGEYRLGTGHIFSRRHLNTRWDYKYDGNCHLQCQRCNFTHVRDQYVYFDWYLKRFGEEKFEDLRGRYKTTVKWNLTDLRAMYAKVRNYRDRIYKRRGQARLLRSKGTPNWAKP